MMEKLRTDQSHDAYGMPIACHWLRINGKILGRVLGGTFGNRWIDEEGETIDAPELDDADAAEMYRMENP